MFGQQVSVYLRCALASRLLACQRQPACTYTSGLTLAGVASLRMQRITSHAGYTYHFACSVKRRLDFSEQRLFCENEAVRGPSPRLPGASAWLQNLFEHPGNTDDVEPRVPTRSAGPPGTILGGSTSSLLSGGCKKVHVVWGQRGTGSCLYTTPTSLLALL